MKTSRGMKTVGSSWKMPLIAVGALTSILVLRLTARLPTHSDAVALDLILLGPFIFGFGGALAGLVEAKIHRDSSTYVFWTFLGLLVAIGGYYLVWFPDVLSRIDWLFALDAAAIASLGAAFMLAALHSFAGRD